MYTFEIRWSFNPFKNGQIKSDKNNSHLYEKEVNKSQVCINFVGAYRKLICVGVYPAKSSFVAYYFKLNKLQNNYLIIVFIGAVYRIIGKC